MPNFFAIMQFLHNFIIPITNYKSENSEKRTVPTFSFRINYKFWQNFICKFDTNFLHLWYHTISSLLQIISQKIHENHNFLFANKLQVLKNICLIKIQNFIEFSQFHKKNLHMISARFRPYLLQITSQKIKPSYKFLAPTFYNASWLTPITGDAFSHTHSPT